LIISYLILE